MGPYCNHCGHRCFVERTVPGYPLITILATCDRGAEHSRQMTGYDYTTAINPYAIADR
jgi:hypothetical protein